MASLRGAGLLALYVGAQVVALFLAFPFKSAGLATTSNPNSPTDPILIIAIIVIAPLFILWGARRSGGLSTLRWIILLGMGASLDITLGAVFALVTPAPVYLPPYGLAQVLDVSVPLAAVVAVGLFLALLIEPQWYVVDTAGFLAGGSLIALLGISFGILPCFILLGVLAVYDFIAVYRTKHMVSLADVVTDLKLPILMVMPTGAGYDYTRTGSFQEQRNIPVEEREAMFMGLGDVVIPGTLIVSAFVWLPATVVFGGVGANLLTAIGTLLGSLVGYAFLMVRVARGNAQAGLPFLNGGALAGYIVTFLLLYHSTSLGLTLAL
ncbi:MAG TPA: presenilin family intramembrane aspartyl protease PSH [Thermoplasmata archaeon]|nr:presenilin family intramembrane aspartyl protease PSH [Thermoplasmata archaeon]